jgi:hypothetical protein
MVDWFEWIMVGMDHGLNGSCLNGLWFEKFNPGSKYDVPRFRFKGYCNFCSGFLFGVRKEQELKEKKNLKNAHSFAGACC